MRNKTGKYRRHKSIKKRELILIRKKQNRRKKFIPALLLLLAAFLVSLFIITSAIASPSDDQGGASDEATNLETQSAELDNSYNQALQELVVIDTEVQRSDNDLASVKERSGEIQAAIVAQEQHLADLQAQLDGRQDALEKRLTSSYKSDDSGYLEVVMGAVDFSEFMNRVDMVNKIAEEDQNLIDSYKETQRAVEDELASLAASRDELVALEEGLIAAEQELLAAQAEQQSYLAALEGEMAANQEQMTQIQAEAAAIEANISDIQSQANTDSGGGNSYSPAPAGGSTITVTATAYCLTGSTATGLQAGPGIIAVDPGVVPLGSQVYVSGYGNAVAADTGGAIYGNKIDVWLPCSDAYAWGVRTVDVTIY